MGGGGRLELDRYNVVFTKQHMISAQTARPDAATATLQGLYYYLEIKLPKIHTRHYFATTAPYFESRTLR